MIYIRSIGKDHVGSALLVAMGIAVLLVGHQYQFGSLSHMGAGFVPVVLGVLMTAVGIAIGATAPSLGAASALAQAGGHGQEGGRQEWRGWFCIVGGIVAFVALGRYGGLVPASFASVFISALGDRENTWKSAAVLAAVITAFGTLVFFYGLHLQLPLFQWD